MSCAPALMISQSFLYNAIFFTYALVLGTVYHVSGGSIPLYFIAFAVGNLVGPLALGWMFDAVGRRFMISATYLLSGALLAVTALLFDANQLTAMSQTIWWSVIFFFASAGASAGYLTVSEIFPLEVRAKAIAVFFAIAQAFGALGPNIYGSLVNSHHGLFVAYLVGAGVMIVGGLAEVFLGVSAEQQALEDVATPLSAANQVLDGCPAHPGPAFRVAQRWTPDYRRTWRTMGTRRATAQLNRHASDEATTALASMNATADCRRLHSPAICNSCWRISDHGSPSRRKRDWRIGSANPLKSMFGRLGDGREKTGPERQRNDAANHSAQFVLLIVVDSFEQRHQQFKTLHLSLHRGSNLVTVR